MYQIRTALVGETRAHYSGYTCYTGISDFTPPDIDTVGYRVFLGNGRYFVSSDVGGGKAREGGGGALLLAREREGIGCWQERERGVGGCEVA